MSRWGMLHRFRVRKAYNSRHFERALKLASKKVHHHQHATFYRDIVIRSLWSLQRYDEVIRFSEKWPNSDHHNLSSRATQRKNQTFSATESRYSEPDSLDHVGWNPDSVVSNWFQLGKRVWFRHPWGWVHWDMPESFELKNTHPALLELASDVLLRPWVDEVKRPFAKRVKRSGPCGLAWSAGVDSTAAMLLLPEDTVLGYHRRDVPSMIDHRNAEVTIDYVRDSGREVVVVPSDHELIRTHHNKMIGFSTDYASGVHLILLADELNLSGIGFGVPIDNSWLAKGASFRNFAKSRHWVMWKARFEEAGLDLVLPINHISEAGALRLINTHPVGEVVNSCLRGDGLQGCGRCWKCFLKNGLMGRTYDVTSTEVRTFLQRRPLRTAQHALYVIKQQGLEDLVPDLAHHLAQDMTWWEEAYGPGLDLIQSPWRSTVEARTRATFRVYDESSPLTQVDLR